MAVFGLLLAAPLAAPVSAQQPLSAIDWLNQTQPIVPGLGLQPLDPAGSDIATSALTPDISVAPLGATGRDAVGLLPSQTTGFPSSLWSASEAETLAELIRVQDVDALPALQDFLYTLLLAEANPPALSTSADQLLLARVDRLYRDGAIDAAYALLDRAGPGHPELFQRWFDLSVLIGNEAPACAAIKANQRLAPSYPARVFCLARDGNWDSAVLTLNTANTLSLITPLEDALLARFLDPDLFEGEPPLKAPADPTPLMFRLFEAIGEPLNTASLPLAFAHADLRDVAGWKAQLAAAERLARTGALPGNQLLGLYTARKPAASGMIWDRVTAIQNFDNALAARDVAAMSATLPAAWRAMQGERLEVTFAQLFADTLRAVKLEGEAETIAHDMALLSRGYERAGRNGAGFVESVAMGEPAGASTELEHAIGDAMAHDPVPDALRSLIEAGRLGETILEAMLLVSDGAAGDMVALGEGLATLRALGLEDVTRRAALQILLLDRRG